jgi:phosphate:Na+ symporter
MNTFMTWAFTILAAIMLFLHGLASFSEEVTRLGGERLREVLRRITRPDWRGAIAGAAATAIVQSSSAVTSMAVGLAHNRTLSPRSALSIMIGAHVGTTLTAWLIAFKVAGLGPVFVTLGGLWSLFGPRPWRPYGKPLFYFGIIFLALDLISQALAPLAENPRIYEWQAALDSPALALIFGALLTAVVQSSSVISGLAVIAVADNILTPSVAIWMVAGANIGTTSTAMLASAPLDNSTRRLAVLNTASILLGVLIFATVLQPVIGFILASELSPGQQVAMVHTVFNLAAAIAALLLLPHLWPRINRWLNKETVQN